jgi:hypothetical protein
MPWEDLSITENRLLAWLYDIEDALPGKNHRTFVEANSIVML